MEKVQWVNVFELFIAGMLIAIVFAFIKGPCHRLAYRMHGYHPHGGHYSEEEKPQDKNEE